MRMFIPLKKSQPFISKVELIEVPVGVLMVVDSQARKKINSHKKISLRKTSVIMMSNNHPKIIHNRI